MYKEHSEYSAVSMMTVLPKEQRERNPRNVHLPKMLFFFPLKNGGKWVWERGQDRRTDPWGIYLALDDGGEMASLWCAICTFYTRK